MPMQALELHQVYYANEMEPGSVGRRVPAEAQVDGRDVSVLPVQAKPSWEGTYREGIPLKPKSSSGLS
ncbi:hypothetical protein WG66_012729 [Moniliophthora roreri]|nr:hypothetical protein WG66_012729 [Moniliophthora roreri]